MKYKWSEIQEAVNTLNRPMIKKIGLSYNKPPLHQEGVTVQEIAQQVLAMAPGDHPHLGPILLGLSDKIQEYSEWH